MGKLLIIASVVVTLITAGLGFANKSKLSKAQTDLADAQSETSKTKASLKTASDTLATAKKDLATAVADKEQAASQLASATTDLEKSKKDLSDAQAQVTTAATDKATLQASYDDIKGKYDALVAAGTGTSGQPVTPEIQDLKARVEEASTLVTKLQQENTDLKTKVSELQAIRDKHNLEIAKKSTEGRILAVNPAWNFVVLNLGDKQGVASNTELLVKRGNQLVGKIRVTSVEPSTSIADIVGNSVPHGTVISPGDHVIYSGSQE